MVKRDLIRNLLILVIAIFIFVALRLLVFTPYTIKLQDSNRYLTENDFVLAIRGEKIQREDFVLYEVDGKEYVGRVIAKENDSFIYMDDVLYLNNKYQINNSYRNLFVLNISNLHPNNKMDICHHSFKIPSFFFA